MRTHFHDSHAHTLPNDMFLRRKHKAKCRTLSPWTQCLYTPLAFTLNTVDILATQMERLCFTFLFLFASQMLKRLTDVPNLFSRKQSRILLVTHFVFQAHVASDIKAQTFVFFSNESACCPPVYPSVIQIILNSFYWTQLIGSTECYIVLSDFPVSMDWDLDKPQLVHFQLCWFNEVVYQGKKSSEEWTKSEHFQPKLLCLKEDSMPRQTVSYWNQVRTQWNLFLFTVSIVS